MKKYRSIKKIIERAMGECFGPEFREARMHLEAAAKAVVRAESKSESTDRSSNEKGWFFDMKTSSIQNISAKQAHDAIGKIESMINAEKNKTRRRTGPDGVMFD